jgi:hypothetical protein
MRFGHNTNVTIGEALYHVQTEDRGETHAIIDTTVHYHGRVLHRRTSKYLDLLPLDAEREHTLERRVSSQHHTVIEELRSGALRMPQHLPSVAKAPASADGKSGAATDAAKRAPGDALVVELMNARTWLAGKRATLQVLVRGKQNGSAVTGAQVTARMDGAAERAEFSAETGAQGQAQIEFEMPRLAGGDCALVIEAKRGEARGQLRFQLRAKPKVPAAG